MGSDEIIKDDLAIFNLLALQSGQLIVYSAREQQNNQS